jgi:hypothetical protein
VQGGLVGDETGNERSSSAVRLRCGHVRNNGHAFKPALPTLVEAAPHLNLIVGAIGLHLAHGFTRVSVTAKRMARHHSKRTVDNSLAPSAEGAMCASSRQTQLLESFQAPGEPPRASGQGRGASGSDVALSVQPNALFDFGGLGFSGRAIGWCQVAIRNSSASARAAGERSSAAAVSAVKDGFIRRFKFYLRAGV